jgi:hypothetical protein
MQQQSEQQQPPDLEAWFVDRLHLHLRDALWPVITTIDRLLVQLVEQLDARERLARQYLEENAELRREVAKLAANVAEMRSPPPIDTTLVN